MVFLRALAKWLKRIFLGIIILVVTLGVLFFGITKFYGTKACLSIPLQDDPVSKTPLLAAKHQGDLARMPDYFRSEETTFLTFPEWYIVYSAREYADFLMRGGLPSHFPYLRSIAQFWCGYGTIYAYNSTHYTSNLWGNVEMVTIGASYSTEYLIKGIYEGTIGRLSEFFGGGATDEDAFMRTMTADYARYLDVTPWYRYPFFPTIGALWQQTPLWGAHPVRKWERKIFLTSEFAVEGVWGFLMEKATNDTGVYPPAATEIQLLVAMPLPREITDDTRVRMEKDFGDGTAVVVVPRYQEFTNIMIEFARAHVQILDIAGAHLMLTTIFAPNTWGYDLPGSPLFIEQIPSDEHTTRIGVVVPTTGILEWIRAADKEGIYIEHLYDY